MAIISVGVLIPTTEEPINSIHPVHASEGLRARREETSLEEQSHTLNVRMFPRRVGRRVYRTCFLNWICRTWS